MIIASGVAVAVGVIVLLATGVLVWGRIAPTETIAMALSGGWFLAVLVAAAIVGGDDVTSRCRWRSAMA